QLAERDRLYDGEALARPVLEIAARLFPIQPVEQLPRGVGHVEERRAVLELEIAMVAGHAESPAHARCRMIPGDGQEEQGDESVTDESMPPGGPVHGPRFQCPESVPRKACSQPERRSRSGHDPERGACSS